MNQQQEIEFLNLLEQHKSFIYHVCEVYGEGNVMYFSDIKQEVVLELWRTFKRPATYRNRKVSNRDAWVKGLILHVASTYSKKYCLSTPSQSHPLQLSESPLNEDQQQMHDHIEQLIAQLDVKERRLIMYYLEQYSYAQIAECEQMTESAVGTRMSRIFNKLRQIASNKK